MINCFCRHCSKRKTLSVLILKLALNVMASSLRAFNTNDSWPYGLLKKIFGSKSNHKTSYVKNLNHTSIRNISSYNRFEGLFDRILMIVCVNWNSPIHVLISHEKLWKPVMKNTVYYGPFDQQSIIEMNLMGLQAVSRSDYEVKPEGTLAYRAALDAINRFPNFDGYLFKHDDIQINVTAMSLWNTSSLWANDYLMYPIKNFSHPQDGVEWWFDHPRSGLKAIMSSLQGSKDFADKLVACTGSNATWPAVGTYSPISTDDVSNGSSWFVYAERRLCRLLLHPSKCCSDVS